MGCPKHNPLAQSFHMIELYYLGQGNVKALKQVKILP